MKKQTAIVLSLFYLLTTTGFAVNVTMCDNKVEAVTFSQLPFDGAGNAYKKKMDKDCCSHHHQYIKLKGHYAAPPTLQITTRHFLTYVAPCAIPHKTLLHKRYVSFNTYSHPPPLHNTPIFLNNCVFLI